MLTLAMALKGSIALLVAAEIYAPCKLANRGMSLTYLMITFTMILWSHVWWVIDYHFPLHILPCCVLRHHVLPCVLVHSVIGLLVLLIVDHIATVAGDIAVDQRITCTCTVIVITTRCTTTHSCDVVYTGQIVFLIIFL